MNEQRVGETGDAVGAKAELVRDAIARQRSRIIFLAPRQACRNLQASFSSSVPSLRSIGIPSIIDVMGANLIGGSKLANVFFKGLVVASASALMTGCVVYTRPAPVVTEVVAEPGVEVVEVEPAPEERVYVYDPGFPPGVYMVGGFYWYNGTRYEHDVFINRYVTVNIREGRYTNVEENRRVGARIEVQHREAYAKAQAERRDVSRTQAARTDTARRETAQPEDSRPGPASPRLARKPQKPGQPMVDAR